MLLGVVNNAKPGLTGPGRVVELALELEDGAAETYVANVGAYANKNVRAVTASIMGVEAQHVAILHAVQALVAAGAADLIALPPDAAELRRPRERRLPRRVLQDHDARPAKEGAVK